ncbi:FAD-binding protein [Roseomonas chloroacetimidivorans]|uniref:FAD-binding protein n=1 Tax=Roseomonas chloroacetimidivorans TaxID=1766656 RepID=UPI003C75AE8F
MTSLPFEIVTADADVVVAGAGGAASRAALSAAQAGARVLLLAKAPLHSGGSSVHGASEIMGINAAAGFGDERDAPEVHYEDTMRLARGFVDASLVRVLAEEAPSRIRELVELGVPFDRNGNRYSLIRSDFNSYGRAMTAQGRTGRAIVDALTGAVVEAGVRVEAPCMLADILRDAEGHVCGALAWDLTRHRFLHIRTPAVVLGSGGVHGAFSQQVSTAEMTGDGQAIAFRHGAELVNLEFHQFGPAMIHPHVQLFSKSIFVLDPEITNAEGEVFLPRYLPEGVSVEAVLHEKVFPFTTSNISRYLDTAMHREIAEGRGTERGGVWFSFTHQPRERLAAGAPNTFRWLSERGLDMAKDRFEVGIAFQCMNGGVRMTGPDAQSTIPGLFVCGEVAGGVRGPDRPGGNSLCEGQVFGHCAGRGAAGEAARHGRPAEPATLAASLDDLAAAFARPADPELSEMGDAIRAGMQAQCLVEKSEAGLSAVRETARTARREIGARLALTPETVASGLSLRNLALVAELVLNSCITRDETRGAHNRVDRPERDDARHGHSYVATRDGEDGIALHPLTYA